MPQFGDGLIIACFVLLLVGIPSLLHLQSRVASLSRLEAKVDLILRQLGVEYDPMADVLPSVMDALQQGNKIEAIKRYRAATGAGLKESKEFVEGLQRRR